MKKSTNPRQIYLLDDAPLAKQIGDQLYCVARMQPFSNNCRTFDQLRNSGGFRPIRNAAASNDITGYYGDKIGGCKNNDREIREEKQSN